MSEVINGILFIRPEPDGKCETCGKISELRPYGKNNEMICFDCGMNDHITTENKMNEHLFDKAKPFNEIYN